MKKLILFSLLLLAAALCNAELSMFAVVRSGNVDDFWQFDDSKPPEIPAGVRLFRIPRFTDTKWSYVDGQWKTASGKRVDLSDVIAWNATEGMSSVKGQYVAQLAGADPLGDRRIDAAQSEFMGILLHAYLQTTRLAWLCTKAVAGTIATNNLTPSERAEVASLMSQVNFPKQDDLTKAATDRAVELKAKLLLPHFLLYQEALAALAAAQTNGTVPSLTNAPITSRQ